MRYGLVGAGLFDHVSLARYAETATAEDLAHVLECRLFVHLSTLWRQSRPVPDAPLGAGYAGFLAPDRRSSFAAALAAVGVGGAAPDLGAPTVVPLQRSDTAAAAMAGPALPNPFAALPDLLVRPIPHRVATVHGDLTLESVLVDPGARTVTLINFSRSREDHVLHDLLRFEAELVTRVLPGKLAAARLDPSAVIDIYRRLHAAADEAPAEPAVRAVYVGLAAVRKAALPLLADPGDWREYLWGLAAHLIGAGVSHGLDAAAQATAFWAAAAALDLAATRPVANHAALERAIPVLLARDPVLDAYRRGRVAEWTGPRYELDERFVALALLVDQGEASTNGRWQAEETAYTSLHGLLAEVQDPALVVLGGPGCGKSTLLRRLELELALEGLAGRSDATPLTFFLPLNHYKPARPGDPPPPPRAWLAAQWAARFPALPPLDDLLAEGRMILLLDALNEIPAASAADARVRVGLWKDFAQTIAATASGARIVFSCRSLDYATPLSTPALRVPQVRVEPLSDAQVQRFLAQYVPVHAEKLWATLGRSGNLDVVRAPYFLRLVVEQVEATGDVPLGRAALFTGFVRQALVREVARDHPLFRPDTLLTAGDVHRLTAARAWLTPHELPAQGVLVTKLAELAYRMQGRNEAAGEAAQVRVGFDTALDLLDHPRDADIVAAGAALGVLDEDLGLDEVLFVHQLIQEYFAARVLARAPHPALVATPWRAVDIRPTARDALATLPPAETLPALPQTGWEETTLLAAVMAPDTAGFIQGVMAANLALAGRCAAQITGVHGVEAAGAGVRDAGPHERSPVLHDLRRALVARSRDRGADVRDRIACALAVGDLGDPRFARRSGPDGDYLVPPLVDVPGGTYPIGCDEPIAWSHRGASGADTDHQPRHAVAIAAFRIGQFPVTNAEYACFLAAGGYDDERWWDTADAARWRRGDLANQAAKNNNWQWRRRFQETPGLFEEMAGEGQFGSEKALAQWLVWMTLDDDAFAAAMDAQWPAKRVTAPEYWRDARCNRPTQPVVGVCWYEARAFCRWLGAQTGLPIRLPAEVEWEAAAAGPTGRRYPWGDDEDPLRANTHAARLRIATPVGVFVEGDTPDGVADLGGNVSEWTSTLWGEEGDAAAPPFAYPYDASDGREDPEAGPTVIRVVRGGAFTLPAAWARCAFRGNLEPEFQISMTGFRVACGTARPR
ncbi:hypothetical protein DCC79_07685 [bacterium]|nr:MAG: hypothetical protein DCC79_07685 [bacterium]